MTDHFVAAKLCRDLSAAKTRPAWQGWSRGFADVKGDNSFHI